MNIFKVKKRYIFSLVRAIIRNMICTIPPIIILQDKNIKKSVVVYAATISAIISVIFNIIGRAADNANLLCELRIDEQIDETLINIKKGNIILETLTNSENFSWLFVKPGAKIFTKNGIKISIIRTTNDDTNRKIKKILPANSLDSCLKLSLISLE